MSAYVLVLGFISFNRSAGHLSKNDNLPGIWPISAKAVRGNIRVIRQGSTPTTPKITAKTLWNVFGVPMC